MCLQRGERRASGPAFIDSYYSPYAWIVCAAWCVAVSGRSRLNGLAADIACKLTLTPQVAYTQTVFLI